MLVTAIPWVMSSHLQLGAVLDNALIRLEMQKSSLKLNNIFVTVLRGADCLEPCWSLDLEYFGVVVTVESPRIRSEHLVGGFVVGDHSMRLQASPSPGCVWHQLICAACTGLKTCVELAEALADAVPAWCSSVLSSPCNLRGFPCGGDPVHH